MERITGQSGEIKVRETKGINIAKTPKAKKAKPQIPIELSKISGEASAAQKGRTQKIKSGVKQVAEFIKNQTDIAAFRATQMPGPAILMSDEAILTKLHPKKAAEAEKKPSIQIDREAMMPVIGEQALDIMDWIQDLTLQPQGPDNMRWMNDNFCPPKDRLIAPRSETAYLPRETGLRGKKLSFYQAFQALSQGKPFNFVAAQWKRDGDWVGALKTQKFSSQKIENFNDLRDFYAGALGSELSAVASAKPREGRMAYFPFLLQTDSQGKEKLKKIGFDKAVSLMREGKQVTFKAFSRTMQNCAPGKDGYPKKTVERFGWQAAELPDFTAGNLNSFIAQARTWLGKPATAQAEIPSGKEILQTWDKAQENWCRRGPGHETQAFYEPYAETEPGKLEEIGFSRAGKLLEKKQTVFFQPKMPVWNEEGYDMKEFRYLSPDLGGTQGGFDRGPVKPTKVGSLEELRDFYRLERDSSREPQAAEKPREDKRHYTGGYESIGDPEV